ncbi:MAG: MGMT family protein [Candidatus Paceibacterota bacterium]
MPKRRYFPKNVKDYSKDQKINLNNIMFKDLVYKYAARIPKGKVATYGQLAKLAGNKKAARVVGMLMKNNPYYPKVSCHRVVGSSGSLVGYTGVGGKQGKKKRLIKEGVRFKGDKVDLKISLWKP